MRFGMPRRSSAGRFVILGLLLTPAATAIGLTLAFHERSECPRLVRGPCDPHVTLPFFLTGVLIVGLGCLLGLALLMIGVALWRRTAKASKLTRNPQIGSGPV